jgi:hypothetical protein
MQNSFGTSGRLCSRDSIHSMNTRMFVTTGGSPANGRAWHASKANSESHARARSLRTTNSSSCACPPRRNTHFRGFHCAPLPHPTPSPSPLPPTSLSAQNVAVERTRGSRTRGILPPEARSEDAVAALGRLCVSAVVSRGERTVRVTARGADPPVVSAEPAGGGGALAAVVRTHARNCANAGDERRRWP